MIWYSQGLGLLKFIVQRSQSEGRMSDRGFVKSRLEKETLPEITSKESRQLWCSFLLKDVERSTFLLSAKKTSRQGSTQCSTKGRAWIIWRCFLIQPVAITFSTRRDACIARRLRLVAFYSPYWPKKVSSAPQQINTVQPNLTPVMLLT